MLNDFEFIKKQIEQFVNEPYDNSKLVYIGYKFNLSQYNTLGFYLPRMCGKTTYMKWLYEELNKEGKRVLLLNRDNRTSLPPDVDFEKYDIVLVDEFTVSQFDETYQNISTPFKVVLLTTMK